MTDVEDLLRAAANQKAAEIAPDSIPPLDVAALAGGHARRGRRFLPPRFARWPGLTVPLAAALAVVAVVALSIALPRVLTGHGAAAPNGAPTSATATGDAGTAPPYYVALTSASPQPYNQPLRITVRSTMTGRALATVRPPTPYETFSLVAGGSDDDTFLVGVQPWWAPGDSFPGGFPGGFPIPVTLVLLHFNPSAKTVRLSSLPVPTLSRGDLQSVALSPDGTQLAVALQASPTVLDLDVYSLTGGGVRTWSVRGAAAARWSIDIPDSNQSGAGGTNPNAMSWLPDGHTLAFDLSETDGAQTVAETVRELDVNGPGGGLLADSRQVFTLDPRTAPLECLDVLQVRADGTTVSCVGYESESHSAKASATTGLTSAAAPSATTTTGRAHGAATYGFGVFSVATGRLIVVKDPTVLGDPLLVSPRLFWQGGDTMIGTLSGPIIVASGSQEHITPWDLNIIPPANYAVVDAAW
jgi:hypothetical protein